jgi:hypothetical protein
MDDRSMVDVTRKYYTVAAILSGKEQWFENQDDTVAFEERERISLLIEQENKFVIKGLTLFQEKHCNLSQVVERVNAASRRGESVSFKRGKSVMFKCDRPDLIEDESD